MAVGDSNWSCRSCGSVNFRTRDCCWQCSAHAPRGAHAVNAGIDDVVGTRPNIVQEGFQEPTQPKSPESERRVWLAREDKMEEADWVCARCMHKNFRSQKDCFRCFAPKSVAPVSRVVVKPKNKNFKL
jgi:hypothetical protein